MFDRLRYLIIFNPSSGAGTNAKRVAAIRKYFRKFGIKCDISETAYRGHAESLAREAIAENYDVVIGCGGDGTLNEVVNGLAGSDVKMGIIPFGTGNVFAREMGFPVRWKKICKLIIRGKSLRLDAGSCNGKLFLLMASAGFDAYSLKAANHPELKKRMGILSYLVGAFRAFANYRFPEFECILDGTRTERGNFVVVSNTSRYGRYFSLTPEATPFDGLLDVVLYRGKGRLNFLKVIILVLLNTVSGNHRRNLEYFLKRDGFFRVKSLEVRSASRIEYQLDGDHWKADKLDIEIREKCVNVILPGKMLKKQAGKIRKPAKDPG